MDFNIRKPTHLLSLFILVATFCLIIILPIYSFFTSSLSVDSNQMMELSSFSKLIIELITLFLQIIIVAIGVFIVVPFIWYTIVNELKYKEILDRIKLRKEGYKLAIFWGIIFTVLMFIIIVIISASIQVLGYNLEESSNITDLEQFFSLPSIFIIVAFQPIGEEIFFRGFLFDKINSLSDKRTAIILTSIIFGIAHLSYGNIFPAIMTGILGLILAYLVVKTKNLISAIVAHILFNVTSVILYVLGQSLMP